MHCLLITPTVNVVTTDKPQEGKAMSQYGVQSHDTLRDRTQGMRGTRAGIRDDACVTVPGDP